jgi:hypothetical protein
MCRLAMGLEEAAKAAPQISNDIASIAEADAIRFMNPASLCLAPEANAERRAWAMSACEGWPPTLGRVEIGAPKAYLKASIGNDGPA